MARPSIYEAAGGEAAFLALAAAHHQRCLEDEVLNHPFSHPGHPQHVERLAAYWAEVLGGPPAFTEDCASDHRGMIGIHAHNGAAHDDLGGRFLACFLQAIDDAGLPDDPELREALRAYMAWATVDVMAYAPEDSVVPDGMAVPRWGWDGLVAPAP